VEKKLFQRSRRRRKESIKDLKFVMLDCGYRRLKGSSPIGDIFVSCVEVLASVTRVSISISKYLPVF